MRILLLADIHANWPALLAILEQEGQTSFDECLVLGDLVDYGLEPSPCIHWVREHATFSIRGNHDHGVAQDVKVQGRNGYKYLTAITRPLTLERISAEERRYLATLPITSRFTLDNARFMLVHATPRDPLDEYALDDVDFWTRRLADVDADVICVGHTHHPYILEVGEKLVINPGSVGQPRDGDPRAAYAIIENQRVELKRADYPVESTIESILESNLPDPGKALLAEVFRGGGKAQPAKGQESEVAGQEAPDLVHTEE
jgi:putative phosphoesterase